MVERIPLRLCNINVVTIVSTYVSAELRKGQNMSKEAFHKDMRDTTSAAKAVLVRADAGHAALATIAEGLQTEERGTKDVITTLSVMQEGLFSRLDILIQLHKNVEVHCNTVFIILT